MTNIDLLLGLIMLGFLGWGIFKGFLWTLVRLASYIGTFVLIGILGEQARDFILKLLNISPLVAIVIVYILFFILMIILGQVVYTLLMKFVTTLKLGCLNRLAGGVFWVMSYFLLLSFIVVIFDISPLSLNGRGVRPQNYQFRFSRLTSHLDELISAQGDKLSEVKGDTIKEALEKANQKFQESGSLEESKEVERELYQSMASSLDEQTFNEIIGKIDIFDRETLKFEGKEITVESLFMQVIIEPLADFLETEILNFE
ncbi:MAG: CvpA family protein [Candidatus Cloacimonetes bacterium]|nr:CvpA family protein [Candidatus Cloacimonadota bacterium]